jgi:hypothetical protein
MTDGVSILIGDKADEEEEEEEEERGLTYFYSEPMQSNS